MELALVFETRVNTLRFVHSGDRKTSFCPRHLVAWISAFQAEGVGSIPTGGAAAARSMFGGVAGLVTRADCESVSGGCDPRTSPRKLSSRPNGSAAVS